MTLTFDLYGRNLEMYKILTVPGHITQHLEENIMQELKDRIVNEGKVLPGNIIKLDGFLNHKVDCQFMSRVAKSFVLIIR